MRRANLHRVKLKSVLFLILGFILSTLMQAACSLALDFDELSNLPCPCTKDYVCLRSSNRCVLKSSVDLFRSCALDDPEDRDALCPKGAICVDVLSRGPLCLPACTVANYGTHEAARKVVSECPEKSACISSDRGLVCVESECDPINNPCVGGSSCVIFNNAGICFAECNPLARSPLPCVGKTLCQPLGETTTAACIDEGTALRGEICTYNNMCEAFHTDGRPMTCGRSATASSQDPYRCYPNCDATTNVGCDTGETCTLFRADVGHSSPQNLGICL